MLLKDTELDSRVEMKNLPLSISILNHNAVRDFTFMEQRLEMMGFLYLLLCAILESLHHLEHTSLLQAAW